MSQKEKVNQFEKMTTWPIPKLVITLGIPTTISMLVTNIYNMADTYFVSELGNSASGAVGVVFGLMAIIQAFGFMFGHGAGSIIARKLGEKDAHSASIFASLSIAACLSVGVLIGALGLIFIEPLMRMLGSTETILPYAKGYGIYILISCPVTMTSFALNNILRYEGKAFFAMIGLTIGGFLNIIGDPIFIFGMDMGIAGAGLSTAISQFVGFAILLSMFLRGKTQSKLGVKFIKENPKGIFQIMATGFPSLCRQGLNSIATMTLNNLAGSCGGDAAVAAMSIVNRIIMFANSAMIGFGQGFQPICGFNYGAKLYNRVKEGFWFCVKYSFVFLVVLAIAMIVFAPQLIHLFRDDMDVVAVGGPALIFQAITFPLNSWIVISNMMLQSVGKAASASLLAASRQGLSLIPLVLILSHFFGITGIQLAQPIGDVITAIIAVPLTANFFKELK